VQLQRKLAELEQQISGAYSEKERAEKNTEGMQFRLELQQGKVEELEGTDKTSCRDTTNSWRGSESGGCGAGLLSELRLQASSAAGTLIDDRTSQESLQARVRLTT